MRKLLIGCGVVGIGLWHAVKHARAAGMSGGLLADIADGISRLTSEYQQKWTRLPGQSWSFWADNEGRYGIQTDDETEQAKPLW